MEFELSKILSKSEIINANLKEKILKTNEKSLEYGLSLSEKDVAMLVQYGKEAISNQARIEFGESVTTKLINKFMKSSYISQDDYADTIAILLDIFYEAKEESEDYLIDDEVIDIMFHFFENVSQGSIELLQNRDMDYLCRNIRHKAKNIFDPDSRYDDYDEEEY